MNLIGDKYKTFRTNWITNMWFIEKQPHLHGILVSRYTDLGRQPNPRQPPVGASPAHQWASRSLTFFSAGASSATEVEANSRGGTS